MADSIQIQAPDGSIVQFPAGTSDDTITSVMAKNFPAQTATAAPSEGALSTAGHYAHAALNGATLGLGDRLLAAGSALTGVGGKFGDYSGNLKAEQNASDQFAQAHPYGDVAAQAAGTIATLPFAPLDALRGLSLGAKVAKMALAGSALGGLQGALSSRDWTNLPQVGKNAAIGGVEGALGGAAVPILGAGIGATAGAVANRLQSVPGISRGALPHLLEAIQADGPAATKATLAELGPQATLADAGPAFLGKAQGAALNSDEARSVLQNALTQRNQGTNQRILSDVDAALGPAEDPQTVSNAIKAHRQQVDNAAYTAALNGAPPVETAPILTELDAAIPQSVGMEKKALQNLRGMMMTTEQRPRLDAFGRQEVNPQTGQPIFDTVPVSQNDASVLHKVKQELDNVIQYDAPGLGVPAGAVARQQGALKMMRGELNNALESQVPGYAEANAASHALANRMEAVQAGTQYLGSGKTTPSPERFASEFGPLSQGEKIAFAKGSRGEVQRILGTKINDLEALRQELQGEGGWNTAKLATVHGQDAADDLVASVDRNRKFRDTYNKVVENSQTAQRQAAARAMKPEPSSQTALVNPNMSLSGFAATAAKRGGAALVNAVLKQDPTKNFGEVARILAAQGAQRDLYHDALVSALSRRQAGSAVAQKIGNAVAFPAVVGATDYLRGRLAAQSGNR